MNIKLIIAFIVFSLALTTKGEFKPSRNFLKGMFEQTAKDKCTSECLEEDHGCKEYGNHLALCESLKERVYEGNYKNCFYGCKKSIPSEKLVACSYHCLKLMFKMEGLTFPENFFDGFIDSLVEQDTQKQKKHKSKN